MSECYQVYQFVPAFGVQCYMRSLGLQYMCSNSRFDHYSSLSMPVCFVDNFVVSGACNIVSSLSTKQSDVALSLCAYMVVNTISPFYELKDISRLINRKTAMASGWDFGYTKFISWTLDIIRNGNTIVNNDFI